MNYPPAHRTAQTDDFHGEAVTDPYRWLEDTNAPETRAWIDAENALTQDWLGRVSSRESIRARLSELWDYPRVGAPFEHGGRWFQLRNSGLQNQDVLWVMDAPDGDGRVLLDPNEMSEDGTVAVETFAVSEDGSLIAYAVSSGGSDWKTWRVREVGSGVDRGDVVEWAKYTGASWRHDGSGFYYGAVDPPAEGAEYLEAAAAPRIWFHRLGTPQSDDVLVFEAPDEPEWVFEPEVSDDGRYLVVLVAHGTAPETQLRVLDIQDPERGFVPLVGDFRAKATYVTNVGETFYLLTDRGAERGRLVAVELSDPSPKRWREVIGESDALLMAARLAGGRLVCHRLVDACSALVVHDLDGRPLHEVPVPAVSSIGSGYGSAGFESSAEGPLIHFVSTSFTDSGTLWQHDLSTGETRLVREPAARIDAGSMVSEQVFVTASDGVRVPLFLTRRADVVPSGDVPVLLYGYGGFDISMTPSFSVTRSTWVERGGIFALAVLRGGGEYGSSWHRAGILNRKQRVFDDFADCARWLVSSGWSSPNRIAINGGSNGGLLVGASVTQHPELFGAAAADVGVMDMLRFHRFTIGWAWKSDFGDPDVAAEYPALRAYSPLHNVRPDAGYPPILLTTGDTDDRVIPGHSFKFAATLQAAAEASSGETAPVLMRTETDAGHGHGMPTEKVIAKATDVLAFLDATVGAAASG